MVFLVLGSTTARHSGQSAPAITTSISSRRPCVPELRPGHQSSAGSQGGRSTAACAPAVPGAPGRQRHPGKCSHGLPGAKAVTDSPHLRPGRRTRRASRRPRETQQGSPGERTVNLRRQVSVSVAVRECRPKAQVRQGGMVWASMPTVGVLLRKRQPGRSWRAAVILGMLAAVGITAVPAAAATTYAATIGGMRASHKTGFRRCVAVHVSRSPGCFLPLRVVEP